MTELIRKADAAKAAQRALALLTADEKNEALISIADALESRCEEILAANKADTDAAREKGTSGALLDRLTLNESRIAGIAQGVRQVAALPDPVGDIIERFERPNGLLIEKIRVPMGVIGMIYEARPNVTVDSAVLALKAGSAILLRGSSSALASNRTLAGIMRDALARTAVPADCVALIEEGGHETVTEMMRLRGKIDLLIPRGGARLISSVVENSCVPVIETGVGNCHIFVDASCEPDMARDIVINAKTQRPGVCNAAETLLIHRGYPHAAELLGALCDAGVTLHATEEACALLRSLGREGFVPACEKDFAEEYLSYDMAVAFVSSTDEAIEHIQKYSTGHTEAILTSDAGSAEKFLSTVDAASVNLNASTRFTDGFEFGFGAEIGISTQKLHARGPLGLRELCSYKYIVRGNGQVRK